MERRSATSPTIWIALLLAAAWVSAARGDVAPPPGAFVASPVSLAEDPDGGVALARDGVQVEMTPTLSRVTVRMTLQPTPESDGSWIVGAPRSAPALLLSPESGVAPLDGVGLGLASLIEAAPVEPVPVASTLAPLTATQAPEVAPESRGADGESADAPPVVKLLSQEPAEYGDLLLRSPPEVGLWSGYPWADLSAMVDGQARVPEVRHYLPDGHLRPRVMEWWVLEIAPPEDGEALVELTFVLPLVEWKRTDRALPASDEGTCFGGEAGAGEYLVVEAFQLVDLALSPRGAAEPGDIRLLPRAPAGTAVCVNAAASRGTDGAIRIASEERDPSRRIGAQLWIPVASVDAAYERDAPYDLGDVRRVWAVHDRVLRFARSGPAGGLGAGDSPQQERSRARLWLPFLQDLRETARRDPDPDSRAFASSVLHQLASHCDGVLVEVEQEWVENEDSACRRWVTAGQPDPPPIRAGPALRPDLSAYALGHLETGDGFEHRGASAFFPPPTPVEMAWSMARRRQATLWAGSAVFGTLALGGGVILRRRGMGSRGGRSRGRK